MSIRCVAVLGHPCSHDCVTVDLKNSMGKVPLDLTASEYLRWEEHDADVRGACVGDSVRRQEIVMCVN